MEEVQNNTQAEPMSESEMTDQLYDHDSSPKEEVQANANEEGTTENAEEKQETEAVAETEETKETSSEEIKYELKAEEENWFLGKEHLDDVESFAKENKLSNESAQKILDNQNSLIREYKDKEEENYWKEVDSWADQLKEDRDFGGERFNENVKLAQKAFEKYIDTDTRKLFDERGYGNYPGLVKAFAKIGRELSGDTFERGQSSEPRKRSMEEMFYGTN